MGWKIFGILVFGGLVFASIQANSGWTDLNSKNKADDAKGAERCALVPDRDVATADGDHPERHRPGIAR